MSEAQSDTLPRAERPAFIPRFHHIGIQTSDLDNCAAWYRAYFGCVPTWTLTQFSELTLSRLPGIRSLVELVVGDVRLHLFERDGSPLSYPASEVGFQHVCLSVASPDELPAWRARWIELYESGDYTFAFPHQPTRIDVDADGVRSFYTLDVNGLEFEFTHVPNDAP